MLPLEFPANKDYLKKYCCSVLEEQLDLEGSPIGGARAINLDMDTLLALLLAFNKKGIHFSNQGDRKSKNEALLEAMQLAETGMDDEDMDGDD